MESSSKKIKKKNDSEDESGEDLFGDDLIKDYEKRPELDNYELDMLAENDEIHPTNFVSRLRAEEIMNQRDQEEHGIFEESEESDEKEIHLDQGEGINLFEKGEEEEEEENLTSKINLEDKKGPLKEYLRREGTRDEIKLRFREFLKSYLDQNGKPIYMNKIREICSENRQSLEIVYFHLSQEHPILAIWVADEPNDILKVLDQVATDLAKNLFSIRYKNNEEKYSIKVRITNLPSCDNLRDLRQSHLNCLIKVRGVITRRSDVLPQIVSLSQDCLSCTTKIGPFYREDDQSSLFIDVCPNCNKKGKKKKFYKFFQFKLFLFTFRTI
jgi:DNA replication licensing factor MCM2